jgi:hypothetical protein
LIIKRQDIDMLEDHKTEDIFQQCTKISDANIEAAVAAVLTCGTNSRVMMG